MMSILMATYNGQKFLSEQIDSILNQSFQDFILYIQDDCSTDDSFSIAMTYAEKYPDKIKVYRNEKNCGGAGINFMKMMISHRDRYVMLCDQDDIWRHNKIELTLVRIMGLEDRYGAHTPLLVHTDLCVVDESLRVISRSFKKRNGVDFNRTKLNQYLVQNSLTGCTIMYNMATAQLLYAIPKHMIMHDWWLGLVVSAFGVIQHIDQATVLYRQHGANEIGSKNVRSLGYRLSRLLHASELKEAINRTYPQAADFLELYGEKLTPQQRYLLRSYCSLPGRRKNQKLKMLCKLNTFKNGLSRNLAYILFV